MTGIRQDVEKRLFEFLSELGDRIGTEKVQQFMEGAITGAVRTKKAVDHNVESLLSLANIPSRRDYNRIRSKLDALQGSVMNLSRTVEDLRDRLGAANGSRSSSGVRHVPKPKKPRTPTPKRASSRPRTSRAR